MRSAYLSEYNVSVYENGEVFRNGRKLKHQICKHGYHRVWVIRKSDGKRFGSGIHRLVAMAFLPNHENKSSVNHMDCNKSNNHVSNLEWCNHKENMRHAHANGLVRAGRKGYEDRITHKHRAINFLRSNGWDRDDVAAAFNITPEMVSMVTSRAEI